MASNRKLHLKRREDPLQIRSAGDYDPHIELPPEAPVPKPGEAAASEPSGPSLMALQEQLGSS
ncbi:MAG TPA: hypothetical protein VKU19_23855 [Bryobacteraceae bacterium]|nr:hypothetical protein [Bryobacteraceae bacterium]